MEKFQMAPVGFVHNEFDEPTGFQEIKKKPSTINIEKAYAEALLNIEDCEYLDVVFYFHRSDNDKLSGITHFGAKRGVFASRSPYRPNGIGVTTVKLLNREANKLTVEGLDAINNTPVLDIKCCDTSLFASESEQQEVHQSLLKTDPRIEIRNNIKNGQTEVLLLKAAQMHGHFCPGLAMGVMAATYAMRQMGTTSDGMEDILAITETNNCFADGVQFVTGCSFGNNALIYKDLGKTAFTLTKRDGKGIRVCSRHESVDVIRQSFPDFQNLYKEVVEHQNHDPELIAKYKQAGVKRAFGTLELPFEKLFAIQQVNTDIPEYASIHESVVCDKCGESVMKNHTRPINNDHYCLECSKTDIATLDGNGIHI